MANDIKIQGGSLGTTLLLIAFIVLKLTNVISWPWWWVLSPLWIPVVLTIIIVIVWLIALYFEKR